MLDCNEEIVDPLTQIILYDNAIMEWSRQEGIHTASALS